MKYRNLFDTWCAIWLHRPRIVPKARQHLKIMFFMNPVHLITEIFCADFSFFTYFYVMKSMALELHVWFVSWIACAPLRFNISHVLTSKKKKKRKNVLRDTFIHADSGFSHVLHEGKRHTYIYFFSHPFFLSSSLVGKYLSFIFTFWTQRSNIFSNIFQNIASVPNSIQII